MKLKFWDDDDARGDGFRFRFVINPLFLIEVDDTAAERYERAHAAMLDAIAKASR